MKKRKSEIKRGSRKKRINVSLSEKLLDHTKDKNRSEALEYAYWEVNTKERGGDDEK